MEALRRHLGLSCWLLLGGSWGVALSLAYALQHPDRVLAMVLRGVCTMRDSEVQWMFGGGAGALKPWAWQRFLDHLGNEPADRANPLLAYYARLLSPDANVRDAAARSWMELEMAMGFDSRSQLLDWDGERWAYETFPAAAEQRKPVSAPQPKPRSAPMSSPPSAAMAAKAAAAGPTAAAELLARGLAFRGDARMSGSTAQALLECHYSVHGAFLRGHTSSSSSPRGSSSNGSSSSSSSLSSVGGSSMDEVAAPPALSRPRPQRPRPATQAPASFPPPPLVASSNTPHRPAGPAHWPPLLESIGSGGALAGIPAIAVHGQLDFVCPATTAYELSRAWPELRLRLVPGAGHSMYYPAITHELVEATRLLYDVSAARYYGQHGGAKEQERRA
ncbi:hypothetical protein HYH02_013849 [Chlamydomonas schloesseri]|uniref:AB hydrolase-1 domain-containing protein n=1 Tax=Chlamydomonas schloesseri TaxID=2026947 RepID=A0A835SQM1_9CHLO|nr:hypothetical protein HYH02_013849 [Chlamydomonas schloesseri]|eukprot:KAG2430021.1 hypothetical protein HYH02_013849 [Chlamydomonas schloesseri]